MRLNGVTPIHCMVECLIIDAFRFDNWGYVTHTSPQHLAPLEVACKHRGVPQWPMCQLLPLCCNATATQVLAVGDGVVFQGVRTWESHEPILHPYKCQYTNTTNIIIYSSLIGCVHGRYAASWFLVKSFGILDRIGLMASRLRFYVCAIFIAV